MSVIHKFYLVKIIKTKTGDVMYKKYLRFIPIHITFCVLLLFPVYLGTRSTIAYNPLEVWNFFTIVYFPIANIGNFKQLITSRGEKNNFISFLITLPIMFLPFLITLPLLLLM